MPIAGIIASLSGGLRLFQEVGQLLLLQFTVLARQVLSPLLVWWATICYTVPQSG